jgi:hypothetical protein
VSFEAFEIYIDAVLEINADSIRIQCRGAVYRVRSLSDLETAVADLFYLPGRLKDPLGEKKSGREFAVIARSAHCD